MAKKKLSVSYDAPITLSFIFISTILFVLNKYVFKDLLAQKALICFGTAGNASFDYSSPLSYIRIIAHIFYAASWNQLLTNATFILLLGPVLEERYGSIVIGLTFFLSSLVSGVLATFSTTTLSGPSGIIFMLILLNTITSLEKKNLSLSSILIFVLYAAFTLYEGFQNNASMFSGNPFIIFCKSNISTLMNLIAGLVGSLAGFLTAPKASKSAKKQNSEKTEVDTSYAKKERKMFSKKEPESKPEEIDTTVIGSIEL